MNQRMRFAVVASFCSAVVSGLPTSAAASGPAQVLLETKFLDLPAGLVFDNAAHLSGAIDLGGASSVGVNGLRGVWGLYTENPFGGTSIDGAYLDKVHVGLQWEIAGLRDLVTVTRASDAAQYGRSTGGAVTIVSKAGSDTLDPISLTKLDRLRRPQQLLIHIKPSLAAEYSYESEGALPTAIYSASNGTLTRAAAVGDPVPGRPGSTFTSFAATRADSPERVYFGATSPLGLSTLGFSGVYSYRRDNGTLTAVLENDPTTNPYGAISSVAIESDKLAIGADKGLLLTDAVGASPQNIVPAGTVYAPGRSISVVRDVRMAGNRIAFTSLVGGLSAAFVTDLDGTLTKIADSQTPVPGGVGNFTTAQQVGISDDWIAFIGFDGSFAQAGLFGFAGGSLFRIAGPGDVKDGKTVRIVDFLPDAIDDNVLAYTAYFTDGTSASYLVAVVPEPSQVAFMLAGLLTIAGCAGWTRRQSS